MRPLIIHVPNRSAEDRSLIVEVLPVGDPSYRCETAEIVVDGKVVARVKCRPDHRLQVDMKSIQCWVEVYDGVEVRAGEE